MNYARTRAVALVATMVTVAFMITPNAAQAQSVGMKASVPFEFYIDSQRFPAGSYTVRSLGNSVVQVSDKSGHSATILAIPITNRSSNREGQLVFNRYNDSNFLSEVLWSGYTNGGRLRQSSLELEIAKSISAERVAANKGNR